MANADSLSGVVYGRNGQGQYNLFPNPLILQVNPTTVTKGKAPGRLAVNQANSTFWGFVKSSNGSNTWVQLSNVGGAGVFSSLTVTAGPVNFTLTAGGFTTIAGTQDISLGADAADHDVAIGSAVGGSLMTLQSGTSGASITSTGVLLLRSSRNGASSVVIDATIGGIDITASGAGAGEDINITATGSSVNITSTENSSLAIYLHANAGSSEAIDIHSDQGSGVASINIHSDVGGVTVASGLASADAINLEAAAGGIDVDSGTGGFDVLTTGAISLDAAAASNFTATGAFDVTLSSTAGSMIVSGGEAVIDAVQLTAGNAAGGVRVTSGAPAATTGLNLVQGAANASIQVGAGDPTHNAPKGTLYIKVDAGIATDRLWINTNATNGWAFFTASA